MSAEASTSNIEMAADLLEKHIQRDERIIARPANSVSIRDARRQMWEGLKEFEFVIHHFTRRFGDGEKHLAGELNRIYEEEKREAELERSSHRYLEGARMTLERNLAYKKKALETIKARLKDER